MYPRPFRARVWVVCFADLGDSLVIEEVVKSMGVHLFCVSLSRNFRCVHYGCVVVLRDVNRLCIEVEERVVDLMEAIPN